MTYIDQNTGPFHKWPFFPTHEIEQTAVNDLRLHHRFPNKPAEINLDSLVQDLFHFTPDYGQPGKGMLGRICFSPNRIEKIILDESLAALNAGPLNEHRRRSTLAHEIGHGRLHRSPFTALAEARRSGCPNHFVRYPKGAPMHAHFSGDIHARDLDPVAPTDNWERMAEWQANRYMAALLTPESLVRMTARDFLEIRTSQRGIRLTEEQHRELAAELSRIFNVSRQFAALRIDTLFPPSQPARRRFPAARHLLKPEVRRR
jgi:Zn-dependent peptidase ImmA (M78 family)